jgi:hypothetical protein
MKTRTVILCAALSMMILSGLPALAAPVAQDVVTVGSTLTLGGAVDVPVYIRDVSGTSLGIDQPPGSRIQSYSLKVNYSPAVAVQSVTFTRGGITSSLTPTFENSPSGAGTISLLDTFHEATNLIPFTLNGAPPGNQVATLHFILAPGATPGTIVTLTLDPTLTQLTDEGGDGATKETTGIGNLALVNGAMTVVAQIPTLTDFALVILAAMLALVGVMRMRL